jgi:hypothetical protein
MTRATSVMCFLATIPAGVMAVTKPSWATITTAAIVLGGTFLIRWVSFREGLVAGRIGRNEAP